MPNLTNTSNISNLLLPKVDYVEGYIEDICSNYVQYMDVLFFKLAILNLTYFLILGWLFKKIPKLHISIFTIDFKDILDSVIIFANVFIAGYYIIFNYKDFIFSNLRYIKIIVYTVLFIVIAFTVYLNRKSLKDLMEYIKKEYKKEQENERN